MIARLQDLNAYPTTSPTLNLATAQKLALSAIPRAEHRSLRPTTTELELLATNVARLVL